MNEEIIITRAGSWTWAVHILLLLLHILSYIYIPISFWNIAQIISPWILIPDQKHPFMSKVYPSTCYQKYLYYSEPDWMFWTQCVVQYLVEERQGSPPSLCQHVTPFWRHNIHSYLAHTQSNHGIPSPHLTSLPLTSPHLTSPHLTSPHLTSPHLTSPHLPSPPFTPHLAIHRLIFLEEEILGLTMTYQLNLLLRP